MRTRLGVCFLMLIAVLLGFSGCVTADLSADEDGLAGTDVISGYPVIFRSVYATGDNHDTPVRYSYIELYNTSDHSVRLDGRALQYAKSDNEKYKVYPFPAGAVIEGKSSYLIRCAMAVGEQNEAYLDACEKFTLSHYDADFPELVLSPKRMRLILSDNTARVTQDVIDEGHVLAYFGACADTVSAADFPYPCNLRGISKTTAARRSADLTSWEAVDLSATDCYTVTDYTPSSSKGANTDIPLAGVTVKFSQAGGRYSDTVGVSLSAPPGYDIVFTTDPAVGLHGFDYYSGAEIKIKDTTAQQYGYTAGLLMEKYGTGVKPRTLPTVAGCVLRACVTDGEHYGPVTTHTYFVMPDVARYGDMLILNITLDPDDFTGKDGIYAVVTDDIFAPRERCDGFMEIFETNGTTPERRYVQLTMNGNGSLAWGQKSMRVSVREKTTPLDGGAIQYDLFKGTAVDDNGDTIDAYKTFVLRNSGNDASCAHFRDALMQEICAPLNVAIQAYRPSLLFINGEFWGIYNLRERYSTDYFQSHYGVLPENLVMLESISPLLTNSWNTKYELNEGLPGDEQDFYDIVDFVAENDMKDEEAFAWVEARMDLDNFTDFFIASCYLANTDWPGNNIKVWRNKNPGDPSGLDTRWRWVMSDMDFGIGHSTSKHEQMFTHALTDDTVCGKLMNRLLRNVKFRLAFADRAAELCNTVFDTARTLPMMYEYVDRLERHIGLNFRRWRGDGGSVDGWKQHVKKIKAFLEGRTSPFIKEMEQKLDVVIDVVTTTAEHASVTLNGITAENGELTQRYRDSTPVTVTATAEEGYRVVGMHVKIGPKTTYIEGNTHSFDLYAKTSVEVITEKES